MRYWARLIIPCPRLCAIITVLLTLLLGAGLGRIGFDVEPSATFTGENQVSRDLSRLHEDFGRDDNDIVLMISGDHLLEWESLQRTKEFRDQIASLPTVDHVASVFDIKQRGRSAAIIPIARPDKFDAELLAEQLTTHPIAAGQLISVDGSLLVMVARIEGESLAVSGVTDVINPLMELSRAFEQADTTTQVRIAGHTAVRADVLITLKDALAISSTASVVVSFLVAMFLFRGIVPVMTVLMSPSIGSIWTFGLMAWFGVPIGGLLTALPTLVYVIGLTDAVHLLLEGQQAMRNGRTAPHAVWRMLTRVGPACFLTSLTTLIGFGSLLFSQTESVQSFGLWAGIGTVFVMFADIFVLPTVLQLLPKKYFTRTKSNRKMMADSVSRFVAPTLRRPGVTTLIGVGLLLALIVPAARQQPDIVWTEAIPDDSFSVQAMRQADEKLGGALVTYVMVNWPDDREFPNKEILQATVKAQQMLGEAPKFSSPFSIVNVLAALPGKNTNERYRNFRRAPENVRDALINPDQRSLVVSARVPNDGAAALNARLDQLNVQLDALSDDFPGFQFTATGTVVAASRNMNTIILDLARSLAIAAVLIFIVFTVTFRSWKIGLLSVVPNVLPLLMTAAGLTLMGMPLQITAALTFTLCLGLAVDDTMHVLIRYQSAKRYSGDNLQAVERTVRDVGPALVVTTLILLSGFGSMLTSPLPGVRIFAGLSAFTLFAALIGDLLIFPAMLVFAGKSTK